MAGAKYSIGIDLGTTNSSVAFIDKHKKKKKISYLEIPQVVSEGDVRNRELLPSFIYFPGEYEVDRKSIALPWETYCISGANDYVAGEYARSVSAKIVGRIVSSAKSWLCHQKIDRRARILPWGSKDEKGTCISPVEASAIFLAHLKDAWDYQMAVQDKGKEISKQEIILTVPASFDEVARELTIEAANQAGLKNIILLEEPQAAFYSWLLSCENSWQKILKDVSNVLVCDVGGGTTDFTLIKVERDKDELSLKRIAVGDHLMLGGDNIDLALAQMVEARISSLEKKLDSQRWAALCHECRFVKEKALDGWNENKLYEKFQITIAGRGSKLIGGAIQSDLTGEEIQRILFDGFFPLLDFEEDQNSASVSTNIGLREWGLPYAREPAITKHMASFLRRHGFNGLPDAILFNGGALKPEIIRKRIVDIIEGWYKGHDIIKSVKVLPNSNLDLAVSGGASYFGLVRHGKGIRIYGGTARSFYVGIDFTDSSDGPHSAKTYKDSVEKKENLPEMSEAFSVKGAEKEDSYRLLCLIPKDLQTEKIMEIKDKEFSLILGRPVSFPLFSSTVREDDEAGQIVEISKDSLGMLPPLFTVLESEGKSSEIPVYLKAWITEIGTLELWCVSRENKKEQWKLKFALSSATENVAFSSKQAVASIDTELLRKSKDLITATFSRKPGKASQDDVKPRGLLYSLEEITREKRDNWNTAFNREIFDSILKTSARRRSHPQYEASWLNIAGFSLRPGFGYPLDDWRIAQIWNIFEQWLQFNKEPQCRLEWWIMWRRVSGGLDKPSQEEIFRKISPYLFPGMKHIKTFTGPHPSGTEFLEMLRMAACLEKISMEHKSQLGNYIMENLKSNKELYWIMARIGSRVPFSGNIEDVVEKRIVETWIEKLLSLKWPDSPTAPFALARISRLTGDRERDIEDNIRFSVAKKLKYERCEEKYILPLLEVVEDQHSDQNLVFGESLPSGLVLKVSN